MALDDVIADETRHRDEIRLVLDGWADAEEARRQPHPAARRDDRTADVRLAARGRDQAHRSSH